MNQTLSCWLLAGCIAVTFSIDRPALGQDASDRQPVPSLTTAAESLRETLQNVELFSPAGSESPLVGVQFSFLSVDAPVAESVFFAEQKEFQKLVKRLSPTTQLRIEESQLAHGWHRVVRSSLIPDLLTEVDRQQADSEASILSEQHVAAPLGRQFSISLDNSPNSAAELVREPIAGFDWLERIRLTPVLESSDRLSLTAHLVVRPVSDDADGVIEARVRTLRALLHEGQSAIALLRHSDDEGEVLLVVMTPGRAKSLADELALKEVRDDAIALAAGEHSDAQVNVPDQAAPNTSIQQAPAPADAPQKDEDVTDEAQLLKEIRELRTLIQRVRGDVLRLRYELRMQASVEASGSESKEPHALQSATEVVHVRAGQGLLVDRGRRVTRIALADPSVVEIAQYSPTEFALNGRKPGTTTVSIWFDGDTKPLMLTVEVAGSAQPVNVLLRPHQTETHLAIEKALDQPVELQFENAPLVEIIRAISQQAGINMVLDAVALEEEGFTTEATRTIHVENITLRSALSILLEDLNSDWVIENEVLRITSKTRLSGKLVAQAYQVLKLAGVEDGRGQRLERLIELITETVAPDTWQVVGGNGTIQAFPGGSSLVVRQTEDVHAQIQTLLQSLSRLLTAQNSSAEKPRGATGYSSSIRRPVEWVDRLENDRQPYAISRPVVVVDTPAPELYQPGQQSGLILRGRTGTPREVGTGQEQRVAGSGLPRVERYRGIYLDRSSPTIKSLTRDYTPSRALLISFRKKGESDSAAAKKLVEHIQQAVKPGPWNTSDAQIEVYVGGTVRLVIRHTPGTHDRIRRLLERMETEVKAEQSDKPLIDGQASTDKAAVSDLAWTGPADDVPVDLDALWDHFGLKPGPALADVPGKATGKYRGGLTVADVRKDSLLSAAHIQKGDILVGLHNWEILSSENVDFVLKQIDEGRVRLPLKFYIVRNGETMHGEIGIARPSVPARR